MVFVADDLGAWLVGLLADAGRKKLVTVVFGDEQQRALRQAATAAVQDTAEDVSLSGGEQADDVARVIGEVFRGAIPEAPSAGQATLLQALHEEIARQLAVLNDAELTGTGQSSADALGVPGTVLAEKLTGHLVREIFRRALRGGPLTPLASQLNQDLTHLQGQRLEGILAQLVSEVRGALILREVASQPVRLAPRPVFLAGREDLLAGLHARLASGEVTPRIVSLCGLGGAGKTSVAIEYAHRQLAETGLVWQFPAEEPAAMAAGFGELAALLGVRAMAGGGDPVAAVHAVLAARPGGWLLIFDNALDVAAVAGVLPPAGDGQVIITSQSPHWPGGRAVEVPVLDQGVAAGFLLDRTGDHDHEAAWELAGELGGLPLALEQAAAYMLAVGRDIAGYLALYRQRRAEMLARGDPAGYDKRVTTTWSLAFARLQEHTPGGVGLLRLLACCAPEAIPYRLLLQPRPGIPDQLSPETRPVLAPLLDDPLAVDDAITALRRYSLISPPASGVVSVHRLVQAITLTQLPEQHAAAWRQAAAALITAALPGDPYQPANWPDYAAVLPHALAALPPGSDPMAWVASYLGSSGNHAAARDLAQQVLDARQQELGAEHPDTLAARAQFADWTGEAGDVGGAHDQVAALLPILERVSGAEHPGTLTARAELAHWTGQAGDPAAARDQYAALLPILERVSGAKHPGTLAARAELAHWTRQAGNRAGT